MSMPGVQLEEIWNAFLEAFSRDSIAQMLRFRLDKRLDHIVAEGAFKTEVFELLERAEEEGWDVPLVREAYRFNPASIPMLRIYEKYGLGPDIALQFGGIAHGSHQASEAGFESIVSRNNPAFDIGLWLKRLTEIKLRVCRIDINGSAQGTGFLIGPEAVLTNFHVVEPVWNEQPSKSALSCLFDYELLADGRTTPGLRVQVAPQGGILVHSKYSAAEKEGKPDRTLPNLNELDFALLRLSVPVGGQPTAGPLSEQRGWEIMPQKPLPFEVDDPIMIAQHPRGAPMKLAMDTTGVIGPNRNCTRIRYRTNTEEGSSGAPVFDRNWKLLALHHYGDPAWIFRPKYNQGVLALALIRDAITASGHGNYLDKTI
jgi:Trypsin-like peptidase domain/Effector-associated domain 1